MKSTTRYAICLSNEDYPVSLEKGKVYPVFDPLPNDPAGYIRVIDESGEDYLFSDERFHVITLPEAVAVSLTSAKAA